MKSLPIYNDTFNFILIDFENDLKTSNYSNSIIRYMPSHLREFFYYLEQKGHEGINYITTKIVTEYYESYLKIRKNQRRTGTLNGDSLNKHQQALNLFLKYLKDCNGKVDFGVHLRYEKTKKLSLKDILTLDEVDELFEACDYSHKAERIRLRDKAMLVILYSCGLRTHQAVDLDISDIDFENYKITVRSGSGNKKRNKPHVPIQPNDLTILENYLIDSRPYFYNSDITDSFFVNQRGTRLQNKSFSDRLSAIIKATENEDLIEKNINPHNLRHSISTHLLLAGMSIYEVQEFLGHASLDSTQVYTHLVELLNAE